MDKNIQNQMTSLSSAIKFSIRKENVSKCSPKTERTFRSIWLATCGPQAKTSSN